jgi:hypothetical protein
MLKFLFEEWFNLVPAPLLEELGVALQLPIRKSWERELNPQDIDLLRL